MYYFTDAPENVFESESPEMIKIREKFKEEVLNRDNDRYSQKWQNNVFFALVGTTLSVLLTAAVVYFSETDFGYPGSFLFFLTSWSDHCPLAQDMGY